MLLTATLEAGFQLDADVDESFTWMITFIDQGPHATTADRTRSAVTH